MELKKVLKLSTSLGSSLIKINHLQVNREEPPKIEEEEPAQESNYESSKQPEPPALEDVPMPEPETAKNRGDEPYSIDDEQSVSFYIFTVITKIWRQFIPASTFGTCGAMMSSKICCLVHVLNYIL